MAGAPPRQPRTPPFPRWCQQQASAIISTGRCCCWLLPHNRPIDRYLRFGIINVKDSKSVSSDRDEIKRTLQIRKAKWDIIATSGTGDNYIGYLGNAAILTSRSRVYTCNVDPCSDEIKIREELKKLTRHRIPQKRGRSLFVSNSQLLAYFPDKHLAKFRINCGRPRHHFCPVKFFRHLGENLGVKCTVMHTNRVLHKNILGKENNMVTQRDVLDAQKAYEKGGDDSHLRRVVMPLEVLLMGYKRLMVNDLGVHQICVDRIMKLTVQQLLKYEEEIESGEDVVLITAKGEAIGLGFASVESKVMATACEDSMVVATITTVIMDQDACSANTPQRTLVRNQSNSP